MNIVSVTLFLSISLPALYASGYCNEVTSLSDQLIQQIKQQNATNSLPMPRRTSVLGDGYGGEGYTVFPLLSNKTTSTTAILIHGLGGTGQEWGFLSLALSFFSLNFVKFIIPTAPMRNVTLLKQTLPSWFDVFLAGTQGLQVDRAQLLDSVARIDRIVRGEHDTGVDYDRIFLVGASQGGGVALSTFLRSPFPLGGCISIASWLPLHEEYPDQLSTKINNKHILLIHGTEDRAVPIAYAEDSVYHINKFGKSVNLTSSLTRVEGGTHLLLTPLVLSSIEKYISTRANGITQYFVHLVKDLSRSFENLFGLR